MKRQRAVIALLGVLVSDHGMRAQTNTLRGLTVTVRPMTLAAGIDELAGATVTVPQARVVGVFNPRVFVVDTAAALMPVTGHRGRVLVLVDDRALSVPATLLVSSTVTLVGVARTLLGVQVTREVPWPRELTPELVKRLEIRAAVLANSVRSADGVELTSAVTSG